jgi:TonB family protein
MPAPWRGRSLSRTYTYVSVAPQKHPPSEAPAGPMPPAGGLRVGERLVLLTHDASLIEALVTVVPQDSLTVVADEAALAHHLLSGNAGVVFIDAGAVNSRPGMAAQLTQRLHQQLPEVVLVAAGDGAAQNELAALVTDGTIYRFVHKPVSAQRVKLFVDAAWRKRDGSPSGDYPVLPMPQLPPIALAPMTRPVPWGPIGAAIVVIAATLAWFLMPANPPAGPAPASVPAAAPRAAPPAADPPLESAAIPTVVVRPNRVPAAAEQASGAAPTSVTVVARRAATVPAAPPPHVAVVIAATIPAAEADAEKRGTTISSSPELVGPPSSTPPVSEARDRLSVAAITLQREYAPDPEFPELAREQDLSGYVDLEFTVNSDGSVADVAVLKSRPAGVFEKSAVAAVSQWRYRPLERDGVPVSEHARLRLNFGYK